MDSSIGAQSSSHRISFQSTSIQSPLNVLEAMDFASIFSVSESPSVSSSTSKTYNRDLETDLSHEGDDYPSPGSLSQNDSSPVPAPQSSESAETEESDEEAEGVPPAQDSSTMADSPVTATAQLQDHVVEVASEQPTPNALMQGLAVEPAADVSEENIEKTQQPLDISGQNKSADTQVETTASTALSQQTGSSDMENLSDTAPVRPVSANLLNRDEVHSKPTTSDHPIENSLASSEEASVGIPASHESTVSDERLHPLHDATNSRAPVRLEEHVGESPRDVRSAGNRRSRQARLLERHSTGRTNREGTGSQAHNGSRTESTAERLMDVDLKELSSEKHLNPHSAEALEKLQLHSEQGIAVQPAISSLNAWKATIDSLGAHSNSPMAGVRPTNIDGAREPSPPANQTAGGTDAPSIRLGEPASIDRSAVNTLQSQGSSTGSASGEPPQAQSTTQLGQAERLRLIQRVARSFTRIGGTGGSVQLRLHPPELGSLSMQVRLDGRNMTAQLTTESTAARDAIMDSLPQLRSRLAEQGFEVIQISVEVSDHGGLDSQNDSNNHSKFGSQQGQGSDNPSGSPLDWRRSTHLRRQLEAAGTSSSTATGPRPSASSGIDLHA